jgi:hypothetical protein
MGTNYYHHYDICGECGRSESRHIGKLSWGWTFAFRGYPGDDYTGQPEIRSLADWEQLLRSGGEIRDEYGDAMTVDEFLSMVRKKATSSNNQTLYIRADTRWSELRESCWLDPEGHSFSSNEFS